MRYYFSKLDSEDREIYKKLYFNMENFEERITINSEYEKVKEIYYMIIKDNPKMFYIHPYKFTYILVGDYIWVQPEYVYDKQKVNEIMNEINFKLKSLEQKLKTINTKLERERFIHKYLMSTIKYKYDYLEDDFECHTIVGSIINRQAVCDGISKAFKLLCDLAKINCNIVYGDSWNEYEKPQKHAWNMVKINENWYYVDLTWNINLSERFKYVRYDYFNIRESDLIKDHRNFDKLEICNSLENNFFYEKKCILNGKNELEKFLINKFKAIKNEDASKNIYFKLYLEEENQDIYNLISSAINKASLKSWYFPQNYLINSNSTQNVYLIRLN